MTSEQYENAADKNRINKAAVSHAGLSAGRSALREAAALESARIYGALCPEHHSYPQASEQNRPQVPLLPVVAAVDLEAARLRRRKKTA